MTTRDRIHAHVRDHIIREGYAPTVREIGAAVGIASPGTVQVHLGNLVAQGRLSHPRPHVFALPPAEWRELVGSDSEK